MNQEREKFVDEVLDKALAGYSQAEPWMGLEGRVLARLEEEKAAPARAGWWKWAWAPAAAALLLVGSLYLARPKTRPPATPNVAERSTPPLATAPTPTPPPVLKAAAQPKQVGRRLEAVPKVAMAARQPQFPAPQQPSEQERLLLAFVRMQPQAAAQQAQEASQPLSEIKIQPLEIPPVSPDENQQAPER